MTKQKPNLEVKVFRLFRVLCPVSKQAYKLKLPKKWKIHNVFHMLLLEKGTNKKGRVDENVTELNNGNKGKKFKIETICDSAVHAKESAGHLPKLYYLVFEKSYLKEKNI